jgi:hypothetical protein
MSPTRGSPIHCFPQPLASPFARIIVSFLQSVGLKVAPEWPHGDAKLMGASCWTSGFFPKPNSSPPLFSLEWSWVTNSAWIILTPREIVRGGRERVSVCRQPDQMGSWKASGVTQS